MKNPFQLIGKSEAEALEKFRSHFQKLFFGDAEKECVCFSTNSLRYIVDIGHQDIRSEGMSYGMYIAAKLGEENLFESLWQFSKNYLQNSSGNYAPYFAWQVGLPNSKHSDFYKMDPGAAPDGEEYFAAALLLAAKKFQKPAYKKEACELLQAMAHKIPAGNVRAMFDESRAAVRFSPMTGNDFTDPSYHTLFFYRLFAEETGDKFWEAVYAESIHFLKHAMHPETGLAADYTEFNGEPKATNFNPMSHYFSGDSWRVVLNLALDFSSEISKPAENNCQNAKDFEQKICRKYLQFFRSQKTVFADYQIDGTPAPNARELTTGLMAMNAAATCALDINNSDDAELARYFLQKLWEPPTPTGTWRYYDGMLLLLAYCLLTSKF